ncbi:LysR family transcriptional regulator [Modestobacter italicus]|uniref:LysR family transcriptional regulator n=1 Tax=Modestobacter italicus (strain DSM 44449 / CECT 9708 / BC 501) TaxID=2732864 RepID=UPI001C97C3DE|nr:LysR family transcriptional regulator [Modestobacter italicus]
MSFELRHLRCLVAIVDAGTLTDAAIALGVSQAAVSRTLAALEGELGARLLRRTAREVSLTATGQRVLPRARKLLAEADQLVAEAAGRATRLRIGHAWSAMGRHTLDFQRRWAAQHPETELQLVRTNSPTAGLAEGACDLAVVRLTPDPRRFDSALVGVERRLCAVAADDPWARRRSVRMADLVGRTLLVDRRTGTTTPELWPEGARPVVEHTQDVDDWLTVIATGRCVGVTAESTAAQYRRPGVAYRPIRDAEPVAVRLAWWRDDPHPASAAATTLLTELYQRG